MQSGLCERLVERCRVKCIYDDNFWSELEHDAIATVDGERLTEETSAQRHHAFAPCCFSHHTSMPSSFGPRRHHEPVVLNGLFSDFVFEVVLQHLFSLGAVYDLGEANEYLNPVGLGTYHSGLQVHGTEWTFASQAGVFSHPPKGANAPFRQSIVLGTTQMSSSEIASLAGTMKPDWPGNSYHLIKKNCNCFSDALAKQILGKGIPGWVNRMADIGSMCSCLIPDEAVGSAPVDAQGSRPAPTPTTRRGGVAGAVTLGSRRTAAQPAAAAGSNSFGGGGGGARLGSSQPESSSSLLGSITSSAPPAADAASRREAVRQAALKRLGGTS